MDTAYLVSTLSPRCFLLFLYRLSQGIIHHIGHNVTTSRQLKFRMEVCEKHLTLYIVILLLTCAQYVSCGDSGNLELVSKHSYVHNNFLRNTHWGRQLVRFGSEDSQRSFSGPRVQRGSGQLIIQRL